MRKTVANLLFMPRGGKREGAGRKPLPEEKRRDRKSLRCLPETWTKFVREAKRQKMNVGQFLDHLMKNFRG